MSGPKASSTTTSQTTTTQTVGDIGFTGRHAVDVLAQLSDLGKMGILAAQAPTLALIAGGQQTAYGISQVLAAQAQGVGESQRILAQAQATTAEALSRAIAPAEKKDESTMPMLILAAAMVTVAAMQK